MARLHTWVINLDRAPDRLARIRGQLDRLGLPWTRLTAIDGRALTPDQQRLLDEPAYHRRHGMTPIANELGCYLSHVAAIRAFAASDAACALILEDDAQLGPDLPAVLDALLARQPHWDMVKLTAVHRGTPRTVLELASGYRLAVMLSRCTGASAYLINRRAAEAYLREPGGLLPMQLPYDHVFDQGWRFGLQVRLIVPQPCGHDEQIASTIGVAAGTTRKFATWRRLPAFAHRLGNEVRRLRYALRELARERRRPG